MVLLSRLITFEYRGTQSEHLKYSYKKVYPRIIEETKNYKLDTTEIRTFFHAERSPAHSAFLSTMKVPMRSVVDNLP